ncbi:rho GTPase-activating protein 8-like [Actinia tenebrosa]|uniref:Rho GTPase-activating protein 8-like n=1 Tax=Actinia tenebrosa TaxID=6105 RepID=A0A6P8I103_ACTTE|nr:rho GTPase-activating protein 8-like [Actinia tenebrosa]
MFDRGQPVEYGEFGDVHCAAAIIKKFLRELPEPLLTFELCDIICSITAISDHDEKLMKAWSVLHDQLPEGNFKLLKYIMVFLKEVNLSRNS